MAETAIQNRAHLTVELLLTMQQLLGPKMFVIERAALRAREGRRNVYVANIYDLVGCRLTSY